MTGAARILGMLETASDRLSPIVVKEVRQLVRGREFVYSFGASLVAGLAVAFFGAADALTGTGTAGRWTFGALMTCLTFLGLAVVPLGAFGALRVERMEQTLELITLTALTPRRVVIGKLLAQGVKLTTLFAAMAPFIAMSFLLGGIDFGTILLSLGVLFLWSLWMSSAGLFLSTLLKSRAMMGLVFGGAAIVLLLVVGLGRMVFLFALSGWPVGAMRGSLSMSDFWWGLAIMTTGCLATMANLVLLAENRLSLATENRVTPLRVGFLVQFLVIAGWTLWFVNAAPRVRHDAVDVLGVIGGLHLAVVAMFTVTEDLIVPRRVLLGAMAVRRWRRMFAIFYPGGGRGAAYVLVQMGLLLASAWLLGATWSQLRWLTAICCYICFFTGAPTFAYRCVRPERPAALKLRVAVLLMLPLSMLLPDVLYYVLWQPDALDLTYSTRHLVNPLRTLANWHVVDTRQWSAAPAGLGLLGLIAYAGLIVMGMNVTGAIAPTNPEGSAAIAEASNSANVLY